MFNTLLTSLQPLLQTSLELVIPAILAMAYSKFHAFTGITIEANQRAALQSALANGAKIVIGGGSMQDAVSYVMQSVPDALQGLGVQAETAIINLLKPHIAAGKAATPTPVATVVTPTVVKT